MEPRNRMRSTLALARQSLKSRGFAGLARDSRNFVAFNILGASTDFTQQRYRLSEQLARTCDYTVRYGPFEGMRLARESWWSAADRGSMILGLYEQEVLRALSDLEQNRTILVDVGAADGYYAIGCLNAGWVKHAYCFEISEHGRSAIHANAELNGCADDITILGEAKPGFLSELSKNFAVDPAQTMIIMDIEGAEEQLLDAEGLKSLSQATAIVELHEHQVSDHFLANLEAEATKAGLRVTYVTTQERNPAAFAELAAWSDDDRWMLCSEGRMQLMRWAILQPM